MEKKYKYYTTLPVIPGYAERSRIPTSDKQLYLRPSRASDLAPLHELRTQTEVMVWTTKGVIDVDEDETKRWMLRSMEVVADWVTPKSNDEEPPATAVAEEQKQEQLPQQRQQQPMNFNYVILHIPDGAGDPDEESHRVIGGCGVHQVEPDLECGYMIRKEFWGKGVTTAAMKALVQAWWSLDRETVEINAERAAYLKDAGAQQQELIDEQKGEVTVHVQEELKARINEINIASKRVLQKCGFRFQNAEEEIERGETFMLGTYRLPRPSSPDHTAGT